jgi:hypothetical protein
MNGSLTTFSGLAFALAMSAIASQTAGADERLPSADAPAQNISATLLDTTIADLGSTDFAKRQQAVTVLKGATPEQVQEIGTTIRTSGDNEVVRRLIEILELRYEKASLDSSEVRSVSESLEESAVSDRWFVSEAARDVLDRHWQRRTEIAVVELSAMNVSLSPKDPTILWKANPDVDQGPFGRMDPTSSQHLKIYVDKAWPNDARAFDLLKRLDSLKSGSFMTQRRLVSIYLIDGHPLAVEQIAVLKGIFGDTGIAERGRVCLGVLNEPRFGAGEGILVGNVQPKSSAADAGIQGGDVIMGMNGEKLTDFDQLVTKLRKFDVGDKVTFSVRSFRFPGNNGTEDIEVTLKGWN